MGFSMLRVILPNAHIDRGTLGNNDFAGFIKASFLSVALLHLKLAFHTPAANLCFVR